MLSDRELQSLRNLGNESETAADEIVQLREQIKASHDLLQFCLDQANEGARAMHDCPAVFACTAIIAALDPDQETTS